MVLRLSDPQVVVVWLVWQWGKAGTGQMQCPYKPRSVCHLHMHTGAQYDQTPVQGTRLFWSWMLDVVQNIQQLLGCCLEHTGHAMILYQFTALQGQPSILGNMPSHSENLCALFPCTQSAVSTEG